MLSTHLMTRMLLQFLRTLNLLQKKKREMSSLSIIPCLPEIT